jgi:DNA ligase (NAD+)
MEGFAEKKADKLLEAIKSSKRQSLARLITALGIRGVGEVVAATLAERYGNLDMLGSAKLAELEEIPGIGPNIAQAIIDWFGLEGNQRIVTSLKENGVWPIVELDRSTQDKPQLLSGKAFVLTGKLERYSRQELKEILISLGARVPGSVSAKTDYLVVGENPGSKFNKAQKLGITILSEEELLELIAADGNNQGDSS